MLPLIPWEAAPRSLKFKQFKTPYLPVYLNSVAIRIQREKSLQELLEGTSLDMASLGKDGMKFIGGLLAHTWLSGFGIKHGLEILL